VNGSSRDRDPGSGAVVRPADAAARPAASPEMPAHPHPICRPVLHGHALLRHLPPSPIVTSVDATVAGSALTAAHASDPATPS
jgi:hypothetical protein